MTTIEDTLAEKRKERESVLARMRSEKISCDNAAKELQNVQSKTVKLCSGTLLVDLAYLAGRLFIPHEIRETIDAVVLGSNAVFGPYLLSRIFSGGTKYQFAIEESKSRYQTSGMELDYLNEEIGWTEARVQELDYLDRADAKPKEGAKS